MIGNKTRGPPLIASADVASKVPSSALRTEKEIKRTQIGKEEGKLSLFWDDMITDDKNPMKPTKAARTSKWVWAGRSVDITPAPQKSILCLYQGTVKI